MLVRCDSAFISINVFNSALLSAELATYILIHFNLKLRSVEYTQFDFSHITLSSIRKLFMKEGDEHYKLKSGFLLISASQSKTGGPCHKIESISIWESFLSYNFWGIHSGLSLPAKHFLGKEQETEWTTLTFKCP